MSADWLSSYDTPNPCGAWVVAAFVVLPVAWLLCGNLVCLAVLRLWRRLRRPVLAVLLRPVSAPSVVVAVGAAFGRGLSWCRSLIDPDAERRRVLGARLAAEPPRNGLTIYEEFEREINALPSGAMRLALRQNLRSMMQDVCTSPAVVARARRSAGQSRAPSWVVAVLRRGGVVRVCPYV